MIRVVVTGSECTGKTTLAQLLAAHYRTAWVPEFARRFVLETGAAPEYRDVGQIARGQIALEDEGAAQAGRLLVQDTDLISTIVYSRHYYGDCPDWIEPALEKRRADLYLLCNIDVPWIPEGEMRDRGDRREEMQALFFNALLDRGVTFQEIRGSRDERLLEAVRGIEPLLRTATPR